MFLSTVSKGQLREKKEIEGDRGEGKGLEGNRGQDQGIEKDRREQRGELKGGGGKQEYGVDRSDK